MKTVLRVLILVAVATGSYLAGVSRQGVEAQVFRRPEMQPDWISTFEVQGGHYCVANIRGGVWCR